ncbi:MAG: type II toxin-antitoxin system Phd/YefM family antitoxin [Thermoanaerobaculia bacterium]
MVKKYSIAEARDNFTSVVHEAEEGTRVELTRRGKPVAVLVGTEEFEQMTKGAPSFREAYENFRREHDLVELDMDPDEIFADVRDPSPGRDFNW